MDTVATKGKKAGAGAILQPGAVGWGGARGGEVWGLGFGVWGLGFRVWGLGFGVQGLGSKVWGVRCRVQGCGGLGGFRA